MLRYGVSTVQVGYYSVGPSHFVSSQNPLDLALNPDSANLATVQIGRR